MSGVRALLTVELAMLLALGGVVAAPGIDAASHGYASVAGNADSSPDAVPAKGKLNVVGRGYGHGRGLSQYGAEGAARSGLGFRRILAFYYPGTKLSGLAHTKIRVLITADDSRALKVSPADGLRVRDLGIRESWKLPVRRGIRRWRIRPNPDVVQFRKNGKWHTWRTPDGRKRLRGAGQFRANEPLTLWIPNGNGEVARRYRGALRAAKPSPHASRRDTVNVVGIENYVRGVLSAEMYASWSQPALRAQAVAARTYAIHERNHNRRRYYQTCDTWDCQEYRGVSAETQPTNRAVRATRREILRYNGNVAFAQFTSSSGGRTASGRRPYLRARKDPWDKWPGNSMHRWSTTVDANVFERYYPSLGKLKSIKVLKRIDGGQWGGRVTRIRLNGSRQNITLSGEDFRWIAGLRSTWFAFR